MKFSEKDVSYDDIKSHKKQGFTLFLEDTFFEKPHKGGGIKLVQSSNSFLTQGH